MSASPAPDANWKPSPSDVEWVRNLVAMTAHMGTWVTSNAIYQLDHERKVLTMVVMTPWYEQYLHERNRLAFAEIGWEVKP